MIKSSIKSSPKISIIVPSYNAESSLPRTLDCLLEQTYENLEIIILNDGSTDSTEQVSNTYAKQHSHVRVVNHQKNSGLFQARLTGADAATGDYIAFLDADDTVSIDYYRTMLAQAMTTDSDLVIGEIVNEDALTGEKTIYPLTNDLPFDTDVNEVIFKKFMQQRGQNHNWHVAWNKLIRKDLWDTARPHYNLITNHLIMAEDMAISFPIWFFAKQASRSKTSYNFYLRGHEEASTSLANLTVKKARKNVDDLITVFTFLDHFFTTVSAKAQYRSLLEDWKYFYSIMWYNNLNASGLSSKDKNPLNEQLKTIADYTPVRRDMDSHMYSIMTRWNDGLEDIKKAITNSSVKTVSFDIFDTLLYRPFGTPSDLFYFMNVEFNTLEPHFTLLDFHDIRINSEQGARLKHPELEDINLDQIYEVMGEDYGIKKDSLTKLKELELKLELRFINRRNTAFELFELSKHLKKNIILTSDMYLPKDTIISMLEKSGYSGWDNLYLSSELNKSKFSGSLFSHILDSLHISGEQVLHIGDSEHSDITMARKSGVKAKLLPSAIDTLAKSGGASKLFDTIGGNINGFIGNEFNGIRTMLAVVANKSFDNPFVSTISPSIFNATPSYIGIFALGMHLYSLSQWLHSAVEQNNYDRLVFLARDGHLPLLAYQALFDDSTLKARYIPTSRKATLALSILHKRDLSHINKFLNTHRQTIGDALTILSPIIDKQKINQFLLKNHIKRSTKLHELPYYELVEKLATIVNNKKIHSFQEAFRNTYSDDFKGKVAVFDVGYSAKPEQVFSRVLEKNIDTYFIHSVSEGYERSRINKQLNLHTLYDYKPSLSSEIRELLISELSPSCTGYLLKNETLEPQFDKKFAISYYEYFVINTIQRSALEFVKAMRDTFGEYQEHLVYTNQYASLPLETLTSHSSGIDKDIFKPFVFEDDMGAGVVTNIATQHLTPPVQSLGDILASRHKLTKAAAYLIIDRGEFIGRVKRRVLEKTKNNPSVQKSLRSGWKVIKRVKRKLRR